MVSRRYRVFVWAGPLLFLNWLRLAFLENPDEHFIVYRSFFLGSLIGHAILAAVWTAFGPAPLVWRLPLSLIWMTMLAATLAINGRLTGTAVFLGACLAGLWLLLQLPLWGLVIGFGIHLRHVDEAEWQRDPRQPQFSIGELLILTALVGVVFGIGRAMMTNMHERFVLVGGLCEIPFLLTAVATITLSLPLLLAALIRRMTLLVVLAAVVLMGMATVCEQLLVQGRLSGLASTPSVYVGIYPFAAATILTIAVVARLNGYYLVSGKSKKSETKT